MKEKLGTTLQEIAAQPSQAKIYESALIKNTLPTIESLLKAKFPHYILDCEDVIQDYAPKMLAQAIAFVKQYQGKSSQKTDLVRHWLNLNLRIVTFDLLDRIKPQKRFVSWEQPSQENPYITVGDQVAFNRANEDETQEAQDREMELIRRFQYIIAAPEFNRPLSRKYNITVAAVVKRRLAQERSEDIAAGFQMPTGSYASIWSRSIRPQLQQIFEDLAA
jgi:hypothetical protein